MAKGKDDPKQGIALPPGSGRSAKTPLREAGLDAKHIADQNAARAGESGVMPEAQPPGSPRLGGNNLRKPASHWEPYKPAETGTVGAGPRGPKLAPQIVEEAQSDALQSSEIRGATEGWAGQITKPHPSWGVRNAVANVESKAALGSLASGAVGAAADLLLNPRKLNEGEPPYKPVSPDLRAARSNRTADHDIHSLMPKLDPAARNRTALPYIARKGEAGPGPTATVKGVEAKASKPGLHKGL